MACGFSSIKIDYSDYPKSLISRINEVCVLKKKLHLSRLFCCSHTCYCANMVYMTPASRYHSRFQSRSKMYNNNIVHPLSDFAELAEAVPIGLLLSDFAELAEAVPIGLLTCGCIFIYFPGVGTEYLKKNSLKRIKQRGTGIWCARIYFPLNRTVGIFLRNSHGLCIHKF